MFLNVLISNLNMKMPPNMVIDKPMPKRVLPLAWNTPSPISSLTQIWVDSKASGGYIILLLSHEAQGSPIVDAFP